MSEPIILHEDDALLVIAKPAGMSVHPTSPEATSGRGATNPGENEGTLVTWLDYRYPDFSIEFPKVAGDIWRPGIVHRLDKDTSGVMVVAKTQLALTNLQNQFRERQTKKIYRALVIGETGEQGEFSGLISRSDEDPTRQQTKHLSFSWSKGTPKSAETNYSRLAYNQKRGVSLVELKPKTGRMHQLRVQLADAGWPILGDDRYGTKASQRASADLGIARQMLHARKLSFTHPITNQSVTFCAEYPSDFENALQTLSFPAEEC